MILNKDHIVPRIYTNVKSFLRASLEKLTKITSKDQINFRRMSIKVYVGQIRHIFGKGTNGFRFENYHNKNGGKFVVGEHPLLFRSMFTPSKTEELFASK